MLFSYSNGHAGKPVIGIRATDEDRVRPSQPGLWQKAVLFGAAFFACAEVSKFLSVHNSPYITFWLPAGLYVAALLLNETRAWPWLVLAALPAHVASHLLQGTPLVVMGCYFAAITAQAVLGAWLVRRFVAERPTLTTQKEFFGFVGYAGVGSTILGATMAASTLVATGLSHSFWESWQGWCGSNGAAIALLSPFILTWFSKTDEYHQRFFNHRAKIVEAALLVAASLTITGILLFRGYGVMSPMKGPVVLPLIWAALRFGPRGATAATLLVALPTAFLTTQYSAGLTPGQLSSGEYVPILQVSLALVCLAGLAPAIILRERDQQTDNLRKSEEQQRSILQAAMDGFWMADMGGRLLEVNETYCRMSGYSKAELQGMCISDLDADESPAETQAHIQTILTQGDALFESRHRRKDGRIFDVEVVAQFQPAEHRFLGFIRDITERKRAEITLRESEAKLRAIFECSRDAIGIAKGGVHIFANPAYLALFGYRTNAAIVGTSMLNHIAPSHRQQVLDLVTRRAAGEAVPVFYETRGAKADGTEFDMEASVSTYALHGEIYSVATIRDITERKRVEEELRQSEFKYRKIFENVQDVFFQVAYDGAIIEISPSIERYSGYCRAELIGKPVENVYYNPEDRAIWLKTIREKGEVTDYELRLKTKDGRLVYASANAHPLLDAEGKAAGIEGSLRDISERKRIEESHARLATAIEQSAETTVITDAQGTILYVNPAFEKSSGYTREEALGQNPRMLKSGKHDAGFYGRMWSTLARGEVWTGHFTNRRKDGALYEEEATISPVRDATGKIVNYIALKLNVTHEAELTAQLRQAQKMEAVGRLAGGVAHDFNNLLMGIMGYAELCLMKLEPNHPIRDWLSEILGTARRSGDITKQLLAFARQQAIAPKALSLNDHISGMLKLLRRLLHEDIELVWKPGSATTTVKMDSSQIDQVMANLAVNARDAIKGSGKVIIETKRTTLNPAFCAEHEGSVPGEYVALAVTDTGCGMDPAILEHIFEPFFTTKGVGENTGLGLATVYGIIKQNNGYIAVQSEPGQGTTFTIYLPCCSEPVMDREPVAATTPGGTETIMLVEDEKSIRVTARAFLDELGYTVQSAETPELALRMAAEHAGQIHLLITDVVMPGLNGRELAKRLTQLHPETRCMFISGYTADVVASRGILDKNLDFLPKPFDRKQLARKVREVLDRV